MVGNFCRVQIIVDFADKLVSAKIKTMGMVTSCIKVSRILKLRSIEGAKINTAKIIFSSEGRRGDSTKICTHEKYPAIWYTTPFQHFCLFVDNLIYIIMYSYTYYYTHKDVKRNSTWISPIIIRNTSLNCNIADVSRCPYSRAFLAVSKNLMKHKNFLDNAIHDG